MELEAERSGCNCCLEVSDRYHHGGDDYDEGDLHDQHGQCMFEGQTMVEEGKVREGKGGGLVVCYRGTWLPQVCVPNVPLYLIILFLHHKYKDTSDSNLLCHQHDNHHWKVGVSADVEIGEKIDQRASWNSSLGVRSFKMLCS